MGDTTGLPPSAVVVRELRSALKLSQAALAERANVDRVEIIAVEKGRNKATSDRMRDGLARAFGLRIEDLRRALQGEMSPAELLKLCHLTG